MAESSSWFIELFAILLIIFLWIALYAAVQLARVFLYSGMQCYPWTTQKLIHVLIFFAAFVRTLFMAFLALRWDIEEGTLKSQDCFERILFYITDELPSILFFTSSCSVILFWSELYYISIDQPTIFSGIIQPLVITVNTVVYICLIIFWILYGTSWSHFDDYVKNTYSYFIAILYFLTSFALFWFGRNATLELREAPIELSLRQQKLCEVGTTTGVCAVTLSVKAYILLMISNKPIYLNSQLKILEVILYFLFLEVLPEFILLYFYRKMPYVQQRTLSDEEDETLANDSEHESEILIPDIKFPDNHSNDVEATIYRLSTIGHQYQANEFSI